MNIMERFPRQKKKDFSHLNWIQRECGIWFETSYHALMHSHAEHHVTVSTVHLQEVMGLRRTECRIKRKRKLKERAIEINDNNSSR